MKYLLEVEHAGSNVVGPHVVAPGALALDLPVPVHDGLQDGGERGDADAGADEDGVGGAEDVGGGSSKRTININLKF